MKILKQGVDPKTMVFVGSCNNCNTEVEFGRGEGKVTYDQRDGDFISIRCPTCGHCINVDLSLGKPKTDQYTTGHCKNKAQPGGCQLHNLQCGYPNCDRKPTT